MKRKTILICMLIAISGCLPQQGREPTAIVRQEPMCTVQQEPTAMKAARVPLVVFAAGSLILPFDALSEAFERRYPQIDVRPEYHGSIQVIRHATELHDEIDMVATADASLIPMLMYGINDPETGEPYADWYIRFATNRLALAYTPTSARASEITTENWYDILSDRTVRVGLSDPRFDASGYRTLMAFALAQAVYDKPTIFREMFDGRFTMPITAFVDDDRTTISVPEVLETQRDAGLLMRGSSIQLIALLQSGDIDYAVEYESVVTQHSLQMVRLPDAINLGVADQQEAYERAVVDINLQRFASVQPRFQGEPIAYGITIPAGARHSEEAVTFIAFLLSPEGRAVMDAQHHPLLDPCSADRYDRVPPELQVLCVPGELQ
jgi:molybdate/tungstate transport system substrate-binding protein